MVEPQESSVRLKMLSEQQKFAAKFMNEGKRLPDEMVAAAEQRFAGFKSLKAEINDDMARAHEALDKIRRKVRENTLSDANRDGLLTSKHDDYLHCLEMNYRNLELLLRKDEEL